MNRVELIMEEIKNSLEFPDKNFGLKNGADWPEFVKELLSTKEIQTAIAVGVMHSTMASVAIANEIDPTTFGNKEKTSGTFNEFINDPKIYEPMLSMLYWGIKAGQRIAEVQALEKLVPSE